MSWRYDRRVFWVLVPLLIVAIIMDFFVVALGLWHLVPATMFLTVATLMGIRLRLGDASDGRIQLPFSPAQQWAAVLLFGIAFTTYRVIAGSEAAYAPGAGTVGVAIWFIAVLRRNGWSGRSERKQND